MVRLEDMRMHNEEVPDARKAGENGEPMNLVSGEGPDITTRQKYRDLKSKLKYLIYVSVCVPSWWLNNDDYMIFWYF